MQIQKFLSKGSQFIDISFKIRNRKKNLTLVGRINGELSLEGIHVNTEQEVDGDNQKLGMK